MRIRSWKWHPDFPASQGTPFSSCWEYQLKAGENTSPHQHDDREEINIALEGTGRITVGNLTRDLHAGEIIFIPRQTNHYLENPSSMLLRGIFIESGVTVADPETDTKTQQKVTARDLDEVAAIIPEQLDEAESLQIIIRLFDLAGYLSEQIESALGLDSDTGYKALQQIEKKVMEAVVQISTNYQISSSFFPKRF